MKIRLLYDIRRGVLIMKFEVQKPVHLTVEANEEEIIITRRRALDEEEFQPTKINMSRVVGITFEWAGPLAVGSIKFEYENLTPLTNKFNFSHDDNVNMGELKKYVEGIIESRNA